MLENNAIQSNKKNTIKPWFVENRKEGSGGDGMGGCCQDSKMHAVA